MDAFAKIEERFPLMDRPRDRPRKASEEGRGSSDTSAAARHALQTLTPDQLHGLLGIEMATIS
jgi:hypothetical protein